MDLRFDLSNGEPDFATPDHVSIAGLIAIGRGYTKYTTTDGSAEMKDAIRRRFKRDGHPTYKDAQLVVGSGAKPVLAHTLTALINPGDKVILRAPYWPPHRNMVEVLGGEIVEWDCPDAKVMILCSPSNPTGKVFSEADLSMIAITLSAMPNTWVICDEIYSEILFNNVKHIPLAVYAPQLRKRIITVNGVSKAYAMTGWRVGWAAGPAPVMRVVRKIMGQVTGCPPSMSQAAAIAALDGPQDTIKLNNIAYERRRDRVMQSLQHVAQLSAQRPMGAFYVFIYLTGAIGMSTPDGVTIRNGRDFTLYLMDYVGVGVSPGNAFGAPQAFRISLTSDMDTLLLGCKEIRAACAALK